jgi:competence protein ComEC
MNPESSKHTLLSKIDLLASRFRTQSTNKNRKSPRGFVAAFLLTLFAVIGGLISPFGPPAASVGPQSDQLKIEAIDVGQGDGLLISTPGHKNVLIDAGPTEAADDVIQALNHEGAQQVDLVVATHPHADHIGGMVKVMDTFPVKLFFDSGQPYSTKTYTQMLNKIRQKQIPFILADPGQEFELDNGIVLHVLAPIKPFITQSRGSVENANSIVIRLTYKNFSVMFTGDSEQETEERMLTTYPDLSAKILKVAHHGSLYATGAAFLSRVSPEVAIISCGANNNYGHPGQSTLDRLKAVVKELYRTDLEGDITIYSDGTSYWVETKHPPTGNLWLGRSPN